MTITVKNSRNQSLALTEANGYAVTDVQGLSPAPSNVNITGVAGGNGSIFNSAMIPQRNIVLTVYILPSIEAHRNALYSFLCPNSIITLTTAGTARSVQISGVVESFDGTMFSQSQMFSISVLCPKPFFEDTTPKTAAIAAGTNTITNNGDYQCGFTAELKVVAGATDISISDGTNTLTIDGTNLLANDVVNICTIPGQIAITKNGTSLINQITLSGSFPKLAAGTNTITLVNCTGTSGGLTYTELYGGV